MPCEAGAQTRWLQDFLEADAARREEIRKALTATQFGIESQYQQQARPCCACM